MSNSKIWLIQYSLYICKRFKIYTTLTKKQIIVAYENNDKRQESVYSSRVKAGKRRTYFFDVRATRANDYFLTITESRKRFDDDGYDRSKLFLYKEDFNKFIKGLVEAVDFVKTDLMPDFDFDAFNHEGNEYEPNANGGYTNGATVAVATPEMVEDVVAENPVAETLVTEEAVVLEPELMAPAVEAIVSETVIPTVAEIEEVDKW
jgi:Protein of unknown function (DUF3276)